MQSPIIETCVVASGQKKSTIINMRGKVLVGIITPAALTSTALKFLVGVATATNSDPAVSACDKYLSSTSADLSYTVAADKQISVAAETFLGVEFMVLEFGTNEAAARTVKLAFTTWGS